MIKNYFTWYCEQCHAPSMLQFNTEEEADKALKRHQDWWHPEGVDNSD